MKVNDKEVVKCESCENFFYEEDAIKLPKTLAYMDSYERFYMCKTCARKKDLI